MDKNNLWSSKSFIDITGNFIYESILSIKYSSGHKQIYRIQRHFYLFIFCLLLLTPILYTGLGLVVGISHRHTFLARHTGSS